MIDNLSEASATRRYQAQPHNADTVVLGAGPAGLSAAYRLTSAGQSVTVIEKEATPGGLCRTFDFRGSCFDLGPHVFIHRSDEISELLHDLGGDQLREITHVEGIYFGDRLYDSWLDAVVDLNMTSKTRAMFSLLMRRARPIRRVTSCEDGLINAYGSTIYSRMVRVHQRKFWGVDPAEIDVSWAKVYEKPTSLTSYVMNRLRRGVRRSTSYEPAKTYYPTAGSRVVYGALEQRISANPDAHLLVDCEVVAVHRDGPVVTAVEVRHGEDGRSEVISGREFVSTIPVTELVRKLRPAAPPEIVEIAAGLRYRSLVVVNLVVTLAKEFPYAWVEVHSSDFKAGRVTNFAQLASGMAGDSGLVPLCLEYYCFEGDDTWENSDEEMVRLAHDELARMGLIEPGQTYDGFVERVRYAYPMYLLGYGELRAALKDYLSHFTNMQSVGRGGIYRYNNMGHSIESGLRSAENVLAGRRHDLWDRKLVDGKI